MNISAHHTVHLVIIKYAYNLLMHALMKNAANEYGTGLITTSARMLMETVERRAQFYASDSGAEYAEIWMSGGEAADLIWHIILHTAGHGVPARDFYALTKEKQKKASDAVYEQ